MRVITGELRGRRLLSPKNNDVRPTSDKVKEAVFDLLQPYTAESFVFADIFAGSGSIGIEAISRGASRVYFSDFSRESLGLVRENLKICGVTERAVLLMGDFRRNICRINEPVDIFFLDPPYAAGYLPDALKTIDEKDNISEDGIVVCEHAFRDKMPEEVKGFELLTERRYGSIAVTLYKRHKEDQQ